VVVKTATECLITLEGVSKVYQQPNGQKISILEPINLEIRAGEIVLCSVLPVRVNQH